MKTPALLAFVVLAVAGDARADIVVFTTGRTMSVRAVRVEGGLATVVLRGGGEATFDAAIVARVMADEVPGDGGREVGDGGREVIAGREATSGRETNAGLEGMAARPYADLIAAAAAAHQVDARLVHAVVEVESNYQARARSRRGAKGLMQLMPATARQYAVRDPYDPRSNIEAGVRHLKDLLGRFDLPLALAAYNAGEATIRRHGGLPPFPETARYVRLILQKTGG